MALVQEVSLEASFENLKIQAISSFSSLCFLLLAEAVSSQLAAAAIKPPTSLSWPTLALWNRQLSNSSFCKSPWSQHLITYIKGLEEVGSGENGTVPSRWPDSCVDFNSFLSGPNLLGRGKWRQL